MSITGEWHKVSKANPCVICGKPDWCKVSADGTVALCARNEAGSFKAVKGGQGWLHRLKEDPRRADILRRWNEAQRGNVRRPTRPTPAPAARSSVVPPASKSSKPAKATSLESARDAAVASAGGTFAAEWTYHYSDDREALRVIRIALGDEDKTYRPIHPAKGGYKRGDPAGKLPLYRLPHLEGEPVVWVFEGEKCADIAVSIGLPATTSAHGSSGADKTDWSPVAGREVIVVPDQGEAGAKYELAVCRLALNQDPPARVKVVHLPGLAETEDIEQYLAAGGTAEKIEAMAADAPYVDRTAAVGGPVLVCMADVKPAKMEWLWPGKFPLGCITLLVGRPGEGKSFLSTDMAARVTTGTPWPDGSTCPKGSVILICAEDHPSSTIRPRLDAHYADVTKVHLLQAVATIGDDGKRHQVMFSLADVQALEETLRAHRDTKLIVIDPIGSFLGGSTDAHRDNEVRAVLSPVAAMAEKYSAAVLVVAHRRKAAGASADDLALGSRAFTGIARAVWHLSRDKDSKDRRLLLPGKSNLAKEGYGLAFTIVGEPPALSWEKDPVKLSADDAIEDEARRGPEPEAREEAERWLADLLADAPVSSAQIKKDASAAGLAFRTVRRAADKLRVRREKCQFSGGWQWRLPKVANEGGQVIGEGGQRTPRVDNLDNMDTFAESE